MGSRTDEAALDFESRGFGSGIPVFDRLHRDVALHLTDVNDYASGMVALRYDVRPTLATRAAAATLPPLSPTRR
jgi:hypothetical protein